MTISQSDAGVVGTTGNKKNQTTIGIVVGIVAFLAVLAAVIVFLISRKKNEDSSASELEEFASKEDSVVTDNPVWLIYAMGETDDPFKFDYEEEHRNLLGNGNYMLFLYFPSDII